MFTLAEEQPYAAVLAPQFVEDYCATCFKSLGNGLKIGCDDCLQVCYCSLSCQRKDWKYVHRLECEVLRPQSNRQLTPLMRLCIRVFLQHFVTRPEFQIAFNGSQFEDLETNYHHYRSDPKYNQFLSDLLVIINISGYSAIRNIQENGGEFDKEKIIPVICAVLCNSFGITDEQKGICIGRGLYIGLSKHNHACSSTSHIIFEGSRAILRSQQQNYDKRITIPYVSRMLPTAERRKDLSSVHFFVCKCEFCEDLEKDAIGLSANCVNPNCQGCCVANGQNDNPTCSKCESKPAISVSEANSMTSSLIKELQNVEKSSTCKKDIIDRLKCLHDAYSEVLSHRNVAILMLEEEILANCGEFAMNGIAEYIDRLGLGAPEVTRRLYLASQSFSSIPNLSDQQRKVIKCALESSIASHGENHSLTKIIKQFE